MAPSSQLLASYCALLLSGASIVSAVALPSTAAPTTTTTTTLTAAATSSPSPSPSASALSCPAADGATVTNATAGISFTIECGVDRYDNDIGLVYTSTLDQCIAACAGNAECVDVSWIPGKSGSCYLKNGVGQAYANKGIWAARAASTTRSFALNCPSSAGTTYADPTVPGRSYAIECDTDHYGADFTTNPTYVSSLTGCIAECDKKTGCQGVVLSGSACYLKTGITAASVRTGLAAARCVGGCPAVLSSTSTAATTSSAKPTSSAAATSTSTSTTTAKPTTSSASTSTAMSTTSLAKKPTQT
ncbi:hypothetical protein LTR53_012187 [Teratosphaeriaceae sp. CCFEE 6253]|nr:hypothetical protein LTR53_012187 [Teratosphaeriaceae sp. CCFEE 6253]